MLLLVISDYSSIKGKHTEGRRKTDVLNWIFFDHFGMSIAKARNSGSGGSNNDTFSR